MGNYGTMAGIIGGNLSQCKNTACFCLTSLNGFHRTQEKTLDFGIPFFFHDAGVMTGASSLPLALLIRVP